jgi:hypothetical protein
MSAATAYGPIPALAAAGISDTTPNPEGGIIERDAAGKPTGVLRETAGRLVTGKVPPQSREETGKVLREHLQMLASYGVVGYVEAMAFRDDLEVYADLADKGLLKQRVQACIAYSEAGQANPDFDRTVEDRAKYARPLFNANCIKVFADGVPTESHTGAMLGDYQAGQPNAPARGLLLFDPAQMAANLVKWDKLGVTVLFHAAGDRAVRSALDAIAAARKANGMNGPIHQVGHSTLSTGRPAPLQGAQGGGRIFAVPVGPAADQRRHHQRRRRTAHRSRLADPRRVRGGRTGHRRVRLGGRAQARSVDRHRNRRHAPQSRRRHAQLRPEGSDHPAAGYHDVFDRCCHGSAPPPPPDRWKRARSRISSCWTAIPSPARRPRSTIPACSKPGSVARASTNTKP